MSWVRPKANADWSERVTSADVLAGDIVLGFTDSYTWSGPSLSSDMLHHGGWDDGELYMYIVESEGTLSSTTHPFDVIHTGKVGVVDYEVHFFAAEQNGGTGIITEPMYPYDVIIQWDENLHGDDRKDWSMESPTYVLYGHEGETDSYQSVGDISYQVWQVAERAWDRRAAKLRKQEDGFTEHDAIKLSLKVAHKPINLTAQATNTNSVEVDWEYDGITEKSDLERKRVGGNYSHRAYIEDGTTSFTDDDVTTGVDYKYRVRSAHSAVYDYTLHPPEWDFANTTTLNKNDLVILYGDRSIGIDDYEVLVNDLGVGGHRVRIIKVNSDVQEFTTGYHVDIIRTGKTIDNINDTRVRISPYDDSLDTIASSVSSGSLIVQWDRSESGAGHNTGYWSFTGETQEMFIRGKGTLWDDFSHANRRVDQVFTSGDLTRDDNGVEIIMVEIDTDSNPIPQDLSDYSNEDIASPSFPQVDIR